AENIKVSGNILSGHGIEIAAATNGEDALKMAASDKPDLILLDIQMPEMNGFEVCRRLKENEATKNIPVIFLTAYGEIEDIVKGFDAGAADYIAKPFKAQELVSRVLNHLQLSYARSEIIVKNAELDERNRQLWESIAAKDKFFSIISHDLKNTFSSIINFTGYLKNNFKTLNANDLEKSLTSINQSSTQVYELLDNLLKWALSQTGKVEFRPEAINIKDIMNETIGSLSASIENKKIKIVTNIDEELIAYADGNMVKTILRNLASNAIKFSHSAGEVEIGAKRAMEGIAISVEDNGVGISGDHIKNLFKIDASVKTSGTQNEKGSGLGLILCREFVEINGGKISVESEPGSGSKFVFTVPEYNEFFK
ncbi:MAG TPA: hybrid sensor histidine kinase/response regulator, partial [Candidatus Wallbacteria bacterium]|nr:hybrid sensor histidine kinase/response regulator [Candidatus Wallbacteria bacterium]